MTMLDHSRAYRWGEDGLLGICDKDCHLCFEISLWNEKDPILKEHIFGLTGPEGNHGEDVKECYYYLDSTPTQGGSRSRQGGAQVVRIETTQSLLAYLQYELRRRRNH